MTLRQNPSALEHADPFARSCVGRAGGKTMKHRLLPLPLAIALTVAAAPATHAQPAAHNEAAFLRNFDGRFNGTGSLRKAGGRTHNLSCAFDGNHSGANVSLSGRCSTALVFGTTIRIQMSVDPQTGRYSGSFVESRGTVANLSGARKGQTLTLSFRETAASLRPNPPATLTIDSRADGLAIRLRGNEPGRGQNMDLALDEL
jgi:hypothetical protein